jgi:deazaflavin-dependent oxidoreductase (nitroreductase family)
LGLGLVPECLVAGTLRVRLVSQAESIALTVPNMWRRLGQVLGAVVISVGVISVVFMVGMRTKSPLVLNAVRRTNRATKRFPMKSSGARGGIASVIRHVGRRSGRVYDTPVKAVLTEDGFVIALPYGLDTDWLKNVQASGSAIIVHEGDTYQVDSPEIATTSVAAPLFSEKDQRTHRRFRVEQYLLVRRESAERTTAQVTRPS